MGVGEGGTEGGKELKRERGTGYTYRTIKDSR